MVLPGALLPVFLRNFALSDYRGGVLLFASFLGSTLGALLAKGRLPFSMARGAALAALGAILLGHASGLVMLNISAFLFGVGLGIAMTSTSLLQSRNAGANRAAELTRINLLWSLGATSGPWFGLQGTRYLGLGFALAILAAALILCGVLAAFVSEGSVHQAEAIQRAVISRRTALLLLLVIPLSTGIEAAVGGWLTTYAERVHATLEFTVAAGTCFWAGLLTSRFLQSFRSFATWSKRSLLVLGPTLMLCGFLLLLFSHSALVSVGAFLLGLGLGPMYPLLLSYSLESGERHNVAFACAGCGASLLPLLTGQIANASGALRWGLAVPFAGALIMLISDLAVSKELTYDNTTPNL